nr:wd40 repeat [Hymenolepis microstoma]
MIFLEEKTELFLELYGNTLIRESSETWLDETASKFIRTITDTGVFDNFHPYISVNNLKSKHRDDLECTFKTWRRKNLPKFDISTYWNSRVRQHLGVRYDAIPNIFDWDCSITLRDRGIKTFDSKEYGRWRSSGVAFSPREASYLSPNRSLASPRYFSYRHARDDLAGATLIGYWGDIVCSPYIAFGTFTDRSPEHSKTLPGGRIVYGASVLSEVNLRCLLWEMQNGKKAPTSIASVEFCVDANETEIAEAEVNLCEKFSIDFYSPGTTFVDLTTRLRSKFIDDSNKASVIYVGISSLVHLEKASKELLEICTDDCRLIIESVLYIIGLKEENIHGYVQRAQEIASSIGFKLEKPVDAMKDHHLYFVRDK